MDFYLEFNIAGIYILSRRGEIAHYIGRSDSNIYSRMKKSINEGEGYTHFWFEYATSSRDAYLKECKYFHLYKPKDNSIHPAVPKGTFWRCLDHTCEWS